MNSLGGLQDYLENSVTDSETLKSLITLFAYRYLLTHSSLDINYFYFCSNVGIAIEQKGSSDSSDENTESERFDRVAEWGCADEFTLQITIIAENIKHDLNIISKFEHFFDCIEKEFSLDKSLSDVFDLFYGYALKQTFWVKSGNIVSQPRIVLETIKHLMFSKPINSVLDPACKSGDLLTIFSNQDPTCNIVGKESVSFAALLAEINLRVHGVKELDISSSNVIHDYSVLNNAALKNSEVFDVVVCNPPYGLPIKKKAGEMSIQSEWLFLDYGLSRLSPEGRAVYLMPKGVLHAEKYEDQRKRLIEQEGLNSVILLPEGLFLEANISVCLLYFDHSSQTESVKFIDASSFGLRKSGKVELSNKEISLVMQWIEAKRESEKSAIVSKKDILEKGATLNPQMYLSFDVMSELINEYEDMSRAYSALGRELEETMIEMSELSKQFNGD